MGLSTVKNIWKQQKITMFHCVYLAYSFIPKYKRKNSDDRFDRVRWSIDHLFIYWSMWINWSVFFSYPDRDHWSPNGDRTATLPLTSFDTEKLLTKLVNSNVTKNNCQILLEDLKFSVSYYCIGCITYSRFDFQIILALTKFANFCHFYLFEKIGPIVWHFCRMCGQ